MTFAVTAALRAQMDLIYGQAEDVGLMVAAHIEMVRPATGAELSGYLAELAVPYDHPLPEGSAIVIVDDDGKEVASRVFLPPGEAQQQVERTTVAARVRSRSWTVRVGIPTAVAWERAGATARSTIAISGVATLTLLLMQAIFLRRWLPALSSLERGAARVGAGDLGPPASAPMPSRELEHLRDAFHDMVNRLRAAREAIARQVEEERGMRHELESLQQQVIRQERLAAIGVLVSGIAHELNNPLQTISGFSELLQHDDGTDDRVRADLALIHQESARASAIIRNLSRFGRQQESTPTPVWLEEIVSSVIELRQRRLQEQDIQLERDERATRPAHAVFTELQQVVLNFVINAEQSVRGCDKASRRIILRTFEEDDLVHLEVEDSGPGVDPENETKLFQPFFTTKPVGEGTGLGLSVSYGIIHSLGGEIGYRRGALGGALFYFSVPVSSANPQ